MTRAERLEREVALVRSQFGELEIGPDYAWIVVQRWPLPAGWSKPTTTVIVLVPPGYPTTPPDNFYTDHDLRLASGQQPGSTSSTQQAGRSCLQFSYHVEANEWRPTADPATGDNLSSYLAAIKRRLEEVN